MDIDDIKFQHEINVEEYNRLRESVDFIRITPERAKCALKNSLYRIIAVDGDTPVGMARVVGDGGYVFFICDVIVHPQYQSKGLGRKLIERVLAWLEAQVDEGETIMVNLMSAMNKEEFYSKLGFHRRPFGNHGSGMSQWISGDSKRGFTVEDEGGSEKCKKL
ncbi:MAG: GNAT family N-acetyltransferase [Roseburia sp.]|nr:GNAT family N-acetyltransferase [Roseburia sp.]